jgi:hypothetical protein
MANFFKDIIQRDPRAGITSVVNDIGLLEPVTRLAVQKIIDEAKRLGVELMIFETYRSKQRQEALYNDGRSKLRKVGVHHYGLACDIVKKVNGRPSWDGDFSLLGKLAKKHGLIWGGDWGNPNVPHNFIDSVHVQRCSINRQKDLFTGTWYPSAEYNPYLELEAIMEVLLENVQQDPIPGSLTINLVQHTGYQDERLEKLQKALELMARVLNSEEFKEGVVNYQFKRKHTFYYRRSLFGRYIDQPYTNEQVYSMIMAAEEEVGNNQPHTIDLYLQLDEGSNGTVIGYGYPEAKEIYTYSIMFDKMTIEALASHYTHEWCHKLGFEHSFERAPNREHSVPYAVGNLISKLAKKLLAVPTE